MNIAVIGYYAGKDMGNDGQSVKTCTLFHALKQINKGHTLSVDTYYLKHNPLLLIWKFIVSLFTCQKYLVLVSSNGRKFLFPILYILARYFSKQIYHNAIGGRLVEDVVRNPSLKKYLCSFEYNWVESHFIENKLQAQGIKNVYYLPNFKNITIPAEKELPQTFNQPMRFCTFSRVVKEKGITDAIECIAKLNNEKVVATLTIYGLIDKAYSIEFEQLLVKYKNFCTYGGVVAANESVKVLKNYDMLLFPTHFFTEGIPGTVIDALCAGLPILARRWRYCNEIIEHQKTGLVYDVDKSNELITSLKYVLKHPQEIYEMRKNCLIAGTAYTQQAVLPQIFALLEGTK